jgi:hypothetical protein
MDFEAPPPKYRYCWIALSGMEGKSKYVWGSISDMRSDYVILEDKRRMMKMWAEGTDGTIYWFKK